MKIRNKKPEKGNKYYITKAKGGYNPCIDVTKEKDTKVVDKECNVLANCVGYATGRFNEIGEYGKCKYLGNTNAENFTKFVSQGLEIGSKPKTGACIVWEGKGSLAGHVEIVEKVVNNNEIYTSASGYNSYIFKNNTRKNTNGNWGMGSNYKFKGFIYNPAVKDYWTTGEYMLLKSKYIRTSPKVATNNYVLVKECMASVKPKLTSQKPNDKAKFKIGVTVELTAFEYDNKGNLWARMKNTWICVKDSTGDQVVKK